MSGGHFGYNQYKIGEIANKIEEEIREFQKPRPPKVTKEGVSIYRVINYKCSVGVNHNYHTFNSALKEFTNPNDYEVLERTDTKVRVVGKHDGCIYEIRHYVYEEYEDGNYYPEYSRETINKFKKAVRKLREAEIYAQRIDWLLSGDDGEESFHERLKEDLRELQNKKDGNK